MSKRGVSKISGNPTPKVGEKATYTIEEWYPSTPKEKRDPRLVTWELFRKRSNGKFTTTTIKKQGDGTFEFGEVAHKHTYRLEAYLYESEGKGASTIEIKPQPSGIPKINKVELHYSDDSKGTVFSYTEKLTAKAHCVNLTGEQLLFTLWEDGGDNGSNGKLFVDSKKGKVEKNGLATADFILTKALMHKAMQGETNPQKLEFYITVEYYAHKKHPTNSVDVQNPDYKAPVSQTPQTIPSQSQNNTPAGTNSSPASQEPESKKQAKGTIDPQQVPAQQASGGKSTTTVNGENVESLIDAYFAKKEYTIKTDVEAGTHTYEFKGTKNQNIDKDVVGELIRERVNKIVLKDKKYVKPESVKEALTKDSYNQHDIITIKLHKLEAEFKKISSSPLDAKVYLVARSARLDGKQGTIIVKEKDGLIKGSPNAVLPLLEITEEQMEATSKEVKGTEKNEFTATFEKGIAKIPVQLRPQSDDDLKQWKDTLSKGKKEGEYTYRFKNPTTITAETKKNIATTILKNAKEGKADNPKIEEGKTAYVEDVEAALETKAYNGGDPIKFATYKKDKEFLFLQVKAAGERQHDKEFLKKEGEYFMIGGCPRCGVLTLEELTKIFPDADEDRKTELMNAFNLANTKFGLNTCQQKAHFFAQVREEVGTGINVRNGESLNYAAEELPKHFSKFSTTGRLKGSPNDLAYQYGRSRLNGYTANEEMIANIAYANREGNGNSASGDGWKYRGRGIIQITFKSKYDKINTRIDTDYPEFGIDIDANNINNLNEGTVASMAYWEEYGCQAEAEKGIARQNLDAIVDIVNSKTPSRDRRWQHLQNMIEIFKVNECSGNERESSAWRHPLDKMELRTHYNSTEHGASNSDHGAAPNRNSKWHDGLDLYAPVGTTTYACVDGEVYDDYNSTTYGNTLGIKGEYNGTTYYFFYAHLSKRSVSKGDKVTAGDPIGETGQSGNASGQAAKMNHLHFEVRTTSERTGGKVDPLTTITELGRDVNTSPDPTQQTGS